MKFHWNFIEKKGPLNEVTSLQYFTRFRRRQSFFLKKKWKKETKRRGLQGPVGLLHLTLAFFPPPLNGKGVASD
jgi:hypothetical protein